MQVICRFFKPSLSTRDARELKHLNTRELNTREDSVAPLSGWQIFQAWVVWCAFSIAFLRKLFDPDGSRSSAFEKLFVASPFCPIFKYTCKKKFFYSGCGNNFRFKFKAKEAK